MHRLKNITLITLTILLFAGYARAQDIQEGNLNSWFLLLNRVQLTPKFSITNEFHERTGSFLHDQGQLLVRPSIDYQLNESIEFSVGYSFIRVWPYAPYNPPVIRNENNVWEQVTLKNDVGNVHFHHRLRQENRWMNRVVTENGMTTIQGNDYGNRFRYRLGLTFDLVKFSNVDQALFFSGFNEFWFTQDAQLRPVDFARNWLYLGLGYRFDPTSNIQLGYMNQYDKVASGFISSPIVQLTLSKSFSLVN